MTNFVPSKTYLNRQQGKAFNVSDFVNELRHLDIKNHTSWSPHVTMASWGLIAILTAVVTCMVGVKPIVKQVETVKKERKGLLGEYEIKKKKLMGLQQYENQLNQMELQFRQQLNQLPKETEIPGLIQDINKAGNTSGLKLENLTLTDEVKKEMFIEQPISMTAGGDFHSFGRFVGSVAELSRIVTIQDFKIVSSALVNKMPTIDYTIKANTYRYLDEPIKPKDDPASKAKKSKKSKAKSKAKKDNASSSGTGDF